MFASISSLRVLLVGASIAAAALAGCAQGSTFGAGSDGAGSDGAGGDGEGGSGGTSGKGGAGMTSATTTHMTTGGVCDGSGVCDTCATCATDPGGPCEPEFLACANDFDCLDFSDCLGTCMGDDACIDTCAQLYPYGAQLYTEYAYCVICGACFGDCDGAGSGC